MTDAEFLEQVQTLEDGLVRYATGGGFGDANYEDLRKLVTTKTAAAYDLSSEIREQAS